MRKLFELIFLLFIFSIVIVYRKEINVFIVDNFIHKKDAYELIPNEYALDYDFEYVSETNDFIVKNQQQILDIFYTYLNSGSDEFYFFCEYDGCVKDISTFTNENTFVNINNFIHPFNTYNKLHITSNSWGKIFVTVDKTYSLDEINIVNGEIYKIIDKIIKDDMTDKEKIKAFHDYIINNTKYDAEYIDEQINDINSSSHKAIGPLIYSKGLCGGYSHTMSLFLNILKIPNYRISSDTHIWNLVYLDNNWYHLDLTWDDPVTSDKSDILLDKYFIIDTDTLKDFNTGFHIYDETIYKETIQTN